jgi:hypothetical protein
MRGQNGGAADPLQEKAKGAAVDIDFSVLTTLAEKALRSASGGA